MISTLPHRIRITSKVSYFVLLVPKFTNEDQVGECDPNTRQIKIKIGLPPSEMVATLLHEIIHALSFENEINLTENQVLCLEDALLTALRLNKGLVHRFMKNAPKAKRGRKKCK